ncbi:MAG TPA: Uma2 family endonuclease [Tepidisphaeraceae bacterium]|nr:Uma2 family endonuclease [Tepidisphaeraceae bacterium]
MKLTLQFQPELVDRDQVLLVATDWSGYEQVIDQLDRARRRYRSTYDDGLLEVIVPGDEHEEAKTTIARLLEVYGMATRSRIQGLGSTTYKSQVKEKGLEPDECYYIGRRIPRNLRRPAGSETNLVPPDLTIEIDVASSSLPRLPVYAALGVKEVWRWRAGKIEVLRLTGGGYKPASRSALLPALDLRKFSATVRKGVRSGDQEQVARDYYESLIRAVG